MESRTLKLVVLGFMVTMGVMTNTASAGFGKCYSYCVEYCAPPGDPAYAKCPFTCLSRCWANPNDIARPRKFGKKIQVHLDQSGHCVRTCTMHTCADSLHDATKVNLCAQKCSEGVCKT